MVPAECLEAPACEPKDAVLTPPGAAPGVLWSTNEAWQATADWQGLGWTDKTLFCLLSVPCTRVLMFL